MTIVCFIDLLRKYRINQHYVKVFRKTGGVKILEAVEGGVKPYFI